jgi:hypothetical protein
MQVNGIDGHLFPFVIFAWKPTQEKKSRLNGKFSIPYKMYLSMNFTGNLSEYSLSYLYVINTPLPCSLQWFIQE